MRNGNKLLSEKCYYVKSGFGNRTAKIINSEMSRKFPKKSI
jgi:hypothetical protein